MLLICVLVALAAAQSPTVVDRSGSIKQLTFASLGAGMVSNNEQVYVYQKSPNPPSAVGVVYSTPTTATSYTSAVQLSPTSGTPATGVAYSPNQDYVMYYSKAIFGGQGVEQLYSVPVFGGNSNLLNPVLAQSAVARPTYNFKPCSCSVGGGNNDQSQLLIQARTSASTDELWVNNIVGTALTRISVPLLGSTGKSVSLQGQYSDFIIYTANPGFNQLDDPYNWYLADWNGNSWNMSPNGQGNVSFIPPASRNFWRSPNSCGSNGQYIAFTSNGGGQNFPQLYVYDTSAKALANGGQPINPTFTTSNALAQVTWSADGKSLFFVWTTTSTTAPFSTDTLYQWTVSTAASAPKTVNTAAYSNSNGPQTITIFGGANGNGPNVRQVGDYLVFSQTAVTGTFTPGLYAYNVKTSTLSANLFPSITADRGQVVSNGAITAYPGPVLSSPNANTAQLVFVVSTSANQTTEVVYSVPVAGGTAAAISTPNANGPTGVVSVHGVICPSGFSANCNLFPTGCTCGSCGSVTCSNYVIFTQTDTNGQSQVFSVQSIATTAAQLSPASSTGLAGLKTRLTSSQGNVPFVTFQAIPSGANNGRNVYFALANAASATLISTGAASPAANGTGTSVLDFTDDSNWICFLSNTAISTAAFPAQPSQNQLFIASTTAASPSAILVNPALQSTDTVTAFKFSPNVKYAVVSIARLATGVRPLTTSIYSSTVSTTVTTVNLTPQNNFTGEGVQDPLANVIATSQFDCGSNFFYYTATLAYTGGLPELYAISVTGGNTYLLSFNPVTGTPVGAYTVARSANRVGFTSSPNGGVSDAFWNTGMSSAIVPCLVAVVALIAFLL